MNKILIFLFLLFYPTSAFAYLDPGTTGIIFSTLIGLFVAGFAYLKNFIKKIRNFVAKLFGKHVEEEKNTQKKK
tara:strand:+ start:831 stop:1052 length:222 start_codon:yes stop_codon:yes gene_type:complete